MMSEPTLDELIEWHRDAAENHEDWAHWLRYKPDDPRKRSVGDPEHHDDAARMHRASMERLEATASKVDRLLDGLSKHARHDEDCSAIVCTCGLGAHLNEARERAGKEEGDAQ